MNLRPMLRHALAGLCLTLVTAPPAEARDAPEGGLTKLETALSSIDDDASAARKRLALRRVIRDAEEAIEASHDKPDRWPLLEFLFRVQQQLIEVDDDSKHRASMLDTCRELVKAPKEFAPLRLKADLLLSQIEQAKKAASAAERADALRPFVARYIGTPAGPEAIRTAILMATEFGNRRLIDDLRKSIDTHYAADREMILFQREHFQGEVFAAPLAGSLKRSDGKLMRFPMDVFGRSAIVLFWSREGEGMEHAKRLAEASKTLEGQLAGRLTILSCNLDELEDAGESIIRGLGVDWSCLHLPGGRENPFFQTYGGSDPYLLRLSATGQALVGAGGVRRHKEDGSANYESTVGSLMARPWTKLDYSSHLNAMAAGDFLVFDPEGGLDPRMPPELKAVPGSTTLERTTQGVPDEKLFAIQDCFVAPLKHQQLSIDEQMARYRMAEERCRKTIAEHPHAPDLWIVRNRLIVALMGLWKTEGKLTHLERAFVEAGTAMQAGCPAGCDVVARFCLARQAMRDPDANPAGIIDSFLADADGAKVGGPHLAAACMLALDAADRVRFEKYRESILGQHTDEPMMWLFTAFLLDRHHQYWMFQIPYTFGWIYNRREGYSITKGDPEEAHRMLKAELRFANGEPFRIPGDLTAEHTAIFFAAPAPWNSKRDDGLPPSPARGVIDVAPFVAARPDADVQIALAVLGEEAPAEKIKDRHQKDLPYALLTVPEGFDHPVVQRLGLLSVHAGLNGVLLDKTGRILIMISGLSPTSSRLGDSLGGMVRKGVARQDELKIQSMIENGQAESAKEIILALAPHQDPEAVDEKGRPIKHPEQSMSHLRARARVYMALKDWDKALADAEVICKRQSKMDADMSMRTESLNEAEALRDSIKEKMGANR